METVEVTKLDTLADRIEQYKTHLHAELDTFVQKHNYYLSLIEKSGFHDIDADPVLLGPGMLARVEIWYSQARKEAYAISGKSRDLQKFYLAAAEQGKANQYELVRLGKYSKDMHTSTDAKEIARRVGGRLEEKAAYYEGEYLRWNGVGDSYEHIILGVKDLFKIAEYEYKMKTPQN